MMNKKRTRTTGHIKYALFAPLTATLLLVSNIETVARTAERLIYSTEESTPRPEREEVASFVNTTVQGLVTFTITVTNSEGKPQPNITLQIKPGNEVKLQDQCRRKGYHRSGYDDSQVCFPRRFLS